jgi:hypothetical protein
MAVKQYNYCLDCLKGIACIFVVFMHCEFPGMLGTAVQAISRFCVPFFFMVSGYFCFRPLERNVVRIAQSEGGGTKLAYNQEKSFAYCENYSLCIIILLGFCSTPAPILS